MHTELVTVSSLDSGPVQLTVAARSCHMLQEAGFLSDSKVCVVSNQLYTLSTLPDMSED